MVVEFIPRISVPDLWKAPGFGRIQADLRQAANVPSLYWRAPFITLYQICRQPPTGLTNQIHAFGLDNAAYITLHMFPFSTSTIHFITLGEGVFVFYWGGGVGGVTFCDAGKHLHF